ncbi:hypothetical protein B5L83_15245 [Klebsiella pneumoniae]|nr:hypothetical protein B5L83_15245 [Klebsiella pneumoniae]
MKTQPATGETYPKSDLFNKAAQAFKKWGVSWDAVGAYNAGFKKTPRQAARRYEYAKKIHYYYTAIKASKRTSSKDQKIAMN